jgi:hypothetical protein
MPLPETDPADARRQALEADALARHVEPAMQVRIVGNQLLHLGAVLADRPADLIGHGFERARETRDLAAQVLGAVLGYPLVHLVLVSLQKYRLRDLVIERMEKPA